MSPRSQAIVSLPVPPLTDGLYWWISFANGQPLRQVSDRRVEEFDARRDRDFQVVGERVAGGALAGGYALFDRGAADPHRVGFRGGVTAAARAPPGGGRVEARRGAFH